MFIQWNYAVYLDGRVWECATIDDFWRVTKSCDGSWQVYQEDDLSRSDFLTRTEAMVWAEKANIRRQEHMKDRVWSDRMY